MNTTLELTNLMASFARKLSLFINTNVLTISAIYEYFSLNLEKQTGHKCLNIVMGGYTCSQLVKISSSYLGRERVTSYATITTKMIREYE